ncbi:MAG: alpha/beta hydrolase [Bacteroidota bacterium]|nr:alpha/beta hydrolase [Bacteroidota bacterium]
MTRCTKGNIAIEEGTIYYVFWKNPMAQDTIILLHDALGSVQQWRVFPELLSIKTNCNVLVYDRLGHGKSSAIKEPRSLDYLECEVEILERIMVYFSLQNVILYGHSDGGSIALLAGGKMGNLVKKIIVEAAHIFVEDITLGGIKTIQKWYQDTDFSEKLSKYHAEKTDMLFYNWIGIWQDANFRNWNIADMVQNISVPLLFIQGEQDQFGSLLQVEQTLQLIRGKAEKYILSDTFHFPFKEKTELVLEKVALFLKNN